MVEENRSQESRLKNGDEAKNYFIEETEQNELMSNKHKKVCTPLNILNTFLFYLQQLPDVFRFLLLFLCLVFLWVLQVLQ